MTEVIMDNLNPIWIKGFDVQYHFEQRENFKVEVYDIDNFDRLHDFGSHDYVGSVQFALHEVVTAREQTLERNIVNVKRAEGKSGIIKITAEEKTLKASEEVFMKFSASFPIMTGRYFFLIHKRISETVWKPVYKSEIRQVTSKEFIWNTVNNLTTDLSGDDVDREIRIDFLQSQKSGKHKHMGQTTMTLAGLKE